LAFLGDFGKFLGLGSSKEVGGQIGGAVGGFFGDAAGAIAGQRIGSSIGSATSSLGGTADQPFEQSALPTPRPENLGAQEDSRSGSTLNTINIGQNRGMTQQAGFGSLLPLLQGAGRFLTSRGGQIATGVGTGVALGLGNGDSRMKPVLTQSRRNKAKVRQLVNFMGIEGTADFLAQSSGQNVSPNEVVALLLRTFRNDGAFITKAQVRNLRRTTNRFKSLEKQVKEAVSMGTTRRSPVRKTVNRSTSIKI